MKIGVLGTGVVGQTLSGKLVELGQDVMVGTRDVAQTMARADPDSYGRPPFGVWAKQNPGAKVGTFDSAAEHAEIVINATNGKASLEALRQAGETNLNGKLLLDISNPLDFSQGMPPFLTVCNIDSLGEQIQRAFPNAKVVKTLNTVTASLMVNPSQIAGGEHTIFVSGDDAGAKTQASNLLSTWFGWRHIIDLGDITTARGVEMYLPLWLRLLGALGTGMLNIQVVH